jgi:hypothetical protein
MIGRSLMSFEDSTWADTLPEWATIDLTMSRSYAPIIPMPMAQRPAHPPLA